MRRFACPLRRFQGELHSLLWKVQSPVTLEKDDTAGVVSEGTLIAIFFHPKNIGCPTGNRAEPRFYAASSFRGCKTSSGADALAFLYDCRLALISAPTRIANALQYNQIITATGVARNS